MLVAQKYNNNAICLTMKHLQFQCLPSAAKVLRRPCGRFIPSIPLPAFLSPPPAPLLSHLPLPPLPFLLSLPSPFPAPALPPLSFL